MSRFAAKLSKALESGRIENVLSAFNSAFGKPSERKVACPRCVFNMYPHQRSNFSLILSDGRYDGHCALAHIFARVQTGEECPFFNCQNHTRDLYLNTRNFSKLTPRYIQKRCQVGELFRLLIIFLEIKSSS